MNLSGTNATNLGSFNLLAGTLNLGGNLGTRALGSFNRTGGLGNTRVPWNQPGSLLAASP